MSFVPSHVNPNCVDARMKTAKPRLPATQRKMDRILNSMSASGIHAAKDFVDDQHSSIVSVRNTLDAMVEDGQIFKIGKLNKVWYYSRNKAARIPLCGVVAPPPPPNQMPLLSALFSHLKAA